jgi:hypothetical protein
MSADLALHQAAAGTLVKLHGSADVPRTMAFTTLS